MSGRRAVLAVDTATGLQVSWNHDRTFTVLAVDRDGYVEAWEQFNVPARPTLEEATAVAEQYITDAQWEIRGGLNDPDA